MSDAAGPALRLAVLAETFAVCRLAPDAAVPGWAATGGLQSVCRTARELSVVCLQAAVPDDVRAERGWRALEVAGPLDFGLTGILAAIAAPLAAAGVSIFALSTYDTDYVLVKQAQLAVALDALTAAGIEIDPAR